MTQNRFEVQHRPQQSRYVLVDHGEDGTGSKMIGEERYLDIAGGERQQRILHHTKVSEDYTGQGLAGILVRAVVEDAIASGHAVVPVCPYVAAWLPKHPEFAEHVVQPAPAHFSALQAGS